MGLGPDPVVAPSLLAADRTQLLAEAFRVVDAGAHWIHVDVMDGHFVNGTGFGAATVAALKDALADRDVLVDVHLMVERPDRCAAQYASAGADLITVHAETGLYAHRAIEAIQGASRLAGVAFNPLVSPSVLSFYAQEIDLALCMTVSPGHGGRPFIESSPPRVAAARRVVPPNVPIQVDGGIDLRTSALCIEAGAQVLVAGTAVFGMPDPAAAYAELAERTRHAAWRVRARAEFAA